MLNIYLAGPWRRREEVRQARTSLHEAGFTVNARWLDSDLESTSDDYAKADSDPDLSDELAKDAIRDLQDIGNSAAMIVMNLEKSEGKAVEQGIALSHGMPLIIVGGRSNIFQYLPNVVVVETLDEAISVLQARVLRSKAA